MNHNLFANWTRFLRFFLLPTILLRMSEASSLVSLSDTESSRAPSPFAPVNWGLREHSVIDLPLIEMPDDSSSVPLPATTVAASVPAHPLVDPTEAVAAEDKPLDGAPEIDESVDQADVPLPVGTTDPPHSLFSFNRDHCFVSSLANLVGPDKLLRIFAVACTPFPVTQADRIRLLGHRWFPFLNRVAPRALDGVCVWQILEYLDELVQDQIILSFILRRLRKSALHSIVFPADFFRPLALLGYAGSKAMQVRAAKALLQVKDSHDAFIYSPTTPRARKLLRSKTAEYQEQYWSLAESVKLAQLNRGKFKKSEISPHVVIIKCNRFGLPFLYDSAKRVPKALFRSISAMRHPTRGDTEHAVRVITESLVVVERVYEVDITFPL